MEKRDGSDLFVNDGSFFEKFKKLQQEKETAEQTKSNASAGAAVIPAKSSVLVNKRPLDSRGGSDGKKVSVSASGGKLAFSLKQKSKVAITPVKFVADEEEERGEAEIGTGDEVCKRQKLDQVDATQTPPSRADVAPSPPSDPTVRKVADKLATFVAKNGRQFEHITRQRNPGDTPFKFLFDSNCPDYKYYTCRLLEEEKALAESKEPQSSNSASVSTSSSRSSNVSQRNTTQQHSNHQAPASTNSRVFNMSNRSNVQSSPHYQMPASALYGTYEESVNVGASSSGEPGGSSAADSIAMMEFYMKKAAQEERKKPPKLSKDEMPPPSSQALGKKGHHMGDYIPQEELEKFLASCNDASAQKSAREAAEKAKIQADNIGHKLLSKMGWKEGEGLGSDKSGRADPVMAGNVKLNNLGVGAHQPGEVTPEDDIYEQYKKRMMLGYRYRPNPLNNPRKAYY